MKRGDHIRVRRRPGFWHHGIYIGGGQIIHYNGTTKSNSTVKVATLAEFETDALGRVTKAEVVEYQQRFSGDKAVLRAKSLLGRGGYKFFSSNCEHVACWCVTGRLVSEQVEVGLLNIKGGGGAALASLAAVNTVTVMGAAAGLSGGAGTMAGLSSLGAMIGGGVPAGLGLAVTAPTALAVGVFRKRYSDDANLPAKERLARKSAREGAVLGGGVGLASSFGMLYGAGTMGLSAAGLTSGLAAVGSVFGAGMLGGVVALACAPTLAVGLVGYICYRKRGGRR